MLLQFNYATLEASSNSFELSLVAAVASSTVFTLSAEVVTAVALVATSSDAALDVAFFSRTTAYAAASSFSDLESASADAVAKSTLTFLSSAVQGKHSPVAASFLQVVPSDSNYLHYNAAIAFVLKSAVDEITAAPVTALVASADSSSASALAFAVTAAFEAS